MAEFETITRVLNVSVDPEKLEEFTEAVYKVRMSMQEFHENLQKAQDALQNLQFVATESKPLEET